MYTFDDRYEKYLSQFNAYTEEYCKKLLTRPEVLGESMKYSLLFGGKRIRPVLMLAVAWLLVKKIVRHPLGVTAGVLILGGGIGNVIDRVCRGYVVDMFDLQFISYPIFNLADCFVVVGVILGAVYYLWFYDKYDKKEPKDDAASES